MNNEAKMTFGQQYAKTLNESKDPYQVGHSVRPVDTLKDIIEGGAKLYGDRPAFWQKFDGKTYTPKSYNEALADVNALGTALLSLGLKGKHIGIIGENSYWWAVSYFAAPSGVGVSVPLDKELAAEDLRALVREADVKCVILSPRFEKVFAPMLTEDDAPILITTGDKPSDPAILTFADMLEKGRKLMKEGDRSFLDAEIDTECMSVLLYTSGTTGLSKGVMLSHRNLCADAMICQSIFRCGPDDVFFSVLPVHHTYECTGGMLYPLMVGASIGYCQGLRYMQQNLKELRPTFFLGVPLIFEKFYANIWKTIRKGGKEKAVKTLLGVQRTLHKVGVNKQLKPLKAITDVFGGRLENIVSGGAAIDPAILDFFNDAGVFAAQGYGLTECAPLVSVNPNKREMLRNASVGHAPITIDVRIDDPDEDGNGEICVRGANIMLGYYKMPEQTAEVLKDGWFHTGDLGHLDKDNYIYITGRKKNVIITANGKNVFPEELEYHLQKSNYVEEAFVWADETERGDDKSIIATIRPNDDYFEEVLGHKPNEDEHQEILQKVVDDYNKDQPIYKRIGRLVVRTEDFEKTSASKIKRFAAENKRLD